MYLFELKHVSFSYPNKKALDDISFTVEKGASLGLLGANGSGKTTLLKLMDGLLFPHTGEVLFDGYEISEKHLSDTGFYAYFRGRVVMVFQNADIQLFNNTVADELHYTPFQLGMKTEDIQKRTEDILRLCEIKHLEDRAISSLSDGEKKRVAIGSVLTINPSVILLDEPTSTLDQRSVSWLVELLSELRKTGKTMIVSTNDLSFIDEVIDDGIIISEDHRMLLGAPAKALLDDTDTLYKANLVHAHVHHHDGIKHTHIHRHFIGHKHTSEH